VNNKLYISIVADGETYMEVINTETFKKMRRINLPLAIFNPFYLISGTKRLCYTNNKLYVVNGMRRDIQIIDTFEDKVIRKINIKNFIINDIEIVKMDQ
jgi:hypothetical protein